MRARSIVPVLLVALAGTGVAEAASAARPTAHSSYGFRKAGRFSVTLNTIAATQISSSPANVLGSQFPITGIGVTCPGKKVSGRSPFLDLGFPGATLKLKHGHYGFSRAYTERGVSKLVPGATTTLKSVKIKLSATVATSKLITGTVSVKAAGCSLKSSTFRAKFTQTLPS